MEVVMEEKEGTDYRQTSISECYNLTKPLRCIVKLGGVAITHKNEFETINEENLADVSSHLRQAMSQTSNTLKTFSMDWSKRHGLLDGHSSLDAMDFASSDIFGFIVVHGAGSFGHFQASRSGVHKGGLDNNLVKAGFIATRISVTSLNLEVVRALAREGIPSIGMSPFSCGWSTCQRDISSGVVSAVVNALRAGLVPVLHGDAVFDVLQGCNILSGDVIIRHLAEQLKPEYVVFLTDVFGVYDRPPTEASSVLLREIAVGKDGSWSVVKPTIPSMKQVETSTADHDTTGGMATKISEAASIARLGICVYIVKVGTSHAYKALTGELRNEIPNDWVGTFVRLRTADD